MSTETSPLKDRLQVVLSLTALVATPVSIIAWFFMQKARDDTNRVERDKLMITTMIERDKLVFENAKLGTDSNRLNLEYVRLAIGILQPTEKIEQPQKELRGWAVEILQDSSPRKLSDEAAKALKNGDANVPSSGSSGWTSWDTEYTTHSYSTSPTITRKNTNPSTPTPSQVPSPKPTHQ